MSSHNYIRSICLSILLLVIVSTLYFSMFIIQQDQQAIVLQLGNPKHFLTKAGLYFKWPLIEEVIKVDNKILSYDLPPEEVISSDQKRIIVDAFVHYKIIDPLAFHKSVGSISIAKARLHSLINSGMRKILGQEKFKDILTEKRHGLMHRISAEINQSIRDMGIIIIDTKIKQVDLPATNSQAIYLRMQTERARKAKEIRAAGQEIAQRILAHADKEVQKIITDAKEKASLLRGEADAQSANILNKITKANPKLYTLILSLEKYKQVIDQQTTLVISPDKFEFFRELSNLK